MDKELEAQALLLKLTQHELKALKSLVMGGSLHDLARLLSTDLASASAIKASMKVKIGAERDADAVRVGIYAGLRTNGERANWASRGDAPR